MWQSLLAATGKLHPVLGFATAVAGLVPIPMSEWGDFRATTTNAWSYTNRFYEVDDPGGWIALVITGRCVTSLAYRQYLYGPSGLLSDERWSHPSLVWEYSHLWGYTADAKAEALSRYLYGERVPTVYYYYSGLRVEYYSQLPLP